MRVHKFYWLIIDKPMERQTVFETLIALSSTCTGIHEI